MPCPMNSVKAHTIHALVGQRPACCRGAAHQYYAPKDKGACQSTSSQEERQGVLMERTENHTHS